MVKSMGITRKIDELGRVVLPMEARKILNLSEKDALEVMLDTENGQIILRKPIQACLRCQKEEGLKAIKPGFYLCAKCLEDLQ